MSWFRRKKTDELVTPQVDTRDELLKTLLELERSRLQSTLAMDQKRAELDLERAKMEFAELERVGTEKRKNLLFAQELKQKKAEQLRAARERRKQIAEQRNNPRPMVSTCEECAALHEGRNPTHSSDLIRHKIERHSQLWLPGGTPN